MEWLKSKGLHNVSTPKPQEKPKPKPKERRECNVQPRVADGILSPIPLERRSRKREGKAPPLEPKEPQQTISVEEPARSNGERTKPFSR